MTDANHRPVEVRARDLLIRLAETSEEIEASQRLRYQIFVEEMSATPTDEQRARKMEFDYFDGFCDHLLVFDDEGRFLLPIGGTGHGTDRFFLPGGLWRDTSDRIFVADTFNGRVIVYRYVGG